jgi:mannose-1-phosphate guanylyltransferase
VEVKQDLGAIDVVVLAGGLGTRLRSVLADRPKVLAPVAGRPFLDHLLRWLERQGARRIILALGHLAGPVEAHLAATAPWNGRIDVATVREPAPLGTGGALRFCRQAIRSDPLIVMNGDTFVEVDLAGFAKSCALSGAEAGLVAVRVEDASRYGRLELTPDDRVAAFIEKDRAHAAAAWINAGIYWLRAAALDRLPTGASSLEQDLLQPSPAGSITAWRTTGRFIDIGTPESLEQAPSILGVMADRETA